jgi:transposase
VSRNTCRKYVRIYQAGGAEELLRPKRRGGGKANDDTLRAAVFRILHEPPRDHGFNRTSWIMRDLREALASEGFSACPQVIQRIFRDAGWKWRKARIALTSNDPDY